MDHKISTISSKPFEGQKPGTSGLRKPVKTFLLEHYTENFVQCILDAVGDKRKLVIGGDGRFYLPEAIEKIVQICAANGVSHVLIGKDGLFSTPAVSCIIRKVNASGGIICTASHNPGGIHADFGIKYNATNGGPAPEGMTNKMYELSKVINEYKICPTLKVDIENCKSEEHLIEGKPFKVDIIDSVDDYLEMLKSIFDFNLIQSYLAKSGNKVLIDPMNGVMGIYATRVFIKELKCPLGTVIRGEPLPDFGGNHPDPNLTYAADLVEKMKKGDYVFGAAFDGDGDRNMILGAKAFFVTPSDSLAVIAANMELIPYFKKTGVKGFARSMPTAGAVDKVAQKLNLNIYECPTGWKFFGNLLDAGNISLCGEESFGTGSDHIREKDGLWAILCWLSILATKNTSVENILSNHWKTYGRNFFTRYDYENCDSNRCNEMIQRMEKMLEEKSLEKTFQSEGKSFVVRMADNFEYKDPIDGSITKKQGIRILFEDGSRLVIRLSGTGSSGATVRLYADCYETDDAVLNENAQKILKPLVNIALEIFQINKYTGRDAPTVIT